jgi:hypothetical protein
MASQVWSNDGRVERQTVGDVWWTFARAASFGPSPVEDLLMRARDLLTVEKFWVNLRGPLQLLRPQCGPLRWIGSQFASHRA